MRLRGLLPLLLTKLALSFKVMKIIIPNTSGLNVVDGNFEPKYFIKNKLRFVSPYVYTYKLYTKKRWIGKRIADVLSSEFCAYDLSYFQESIKKGYVKVNEENVSCDYLMKSNDLIQHKLLLFEKPVMCNKILILYEDKNFICVYKSASLPTHPVGFYQYNSLLRLLQNYISSTLAKGHPSGGDSSGEANQKDGQAEPNEGDVIKINFNFRKANFGDIPGVGPPSQEDPQQGGEPKGGEPDQGRSQVGKHTAEERAQLAENSKKRKQSETLLDNYLNGSGQNRKRVSTSLKGDNTNGGGDHPTNQGELKEGEAPNGLLSEGKANADRTEKSDKSLCTDKSEELNGQAYASFPPVPHKAQWRGKRPKCRNNERKDKPEKDDSYIYTLHRLDKLTSGIVLFGKNKSFSTFFSQNISNNSITKSYVTRVEGDFRALIRTLLDQKKVIDDWDNKTFNELVEEFCSVGKDDSSLPFNGSNSFKNDIFLYRNGYCGEGALSGEEDMEALASIVREKRGYLLDEFDVEKFELGGASRGGSHGGSSQGDGSREDSSREHSRASVEDEPLRQHFVVDFGYMYCENKKLLKYVFTKYTQGNRQIAEEYCLKPSITRFMFLAYNPELKESLVLCQPITGRTHQIRAHLKSLSFPISNDAQYNDNFAKEYMEKSVYLHFHEGDHSGEQSGEQLGEQLGEHSGEQLGEHSGEGVPPNQDKKDSPEKYTHFPLIPFLNTSFHWLYDEKINLNDTYTEADLNRYFFKQISNITYHSSGIFLHSFRYTWENVFDVFTLLPKWCSLFCLPKGLLAFLLYGSLS
ncbi:pseudouridylate synthase, putative [Plasmodium vivax]|uniref:Pseudouridylate synthase, putative n=1 Tax=Plasmodium vivax TaxID=5855 RepID=A0A564ZSB0_PLAVI|nr:pseudouridylate synthase, putative [Plasmodium vivax]